MVRTRFAPSPTGYLHIGGVRTALFNWLFARQHGGQFLLRIDDTDQERNVEAALQPILEGFRWLGMDWDEGPDVGGPYGPYFQSQRGKRYAAAVTTLLEKGAAYRDYATAEELAAERTTAEKEKRAFLYSRRWMAEGDADARRFESEGRQAVVRLKMPREGVCKFFDHVRGDCEFEWAREQDHVIQRADGTCLYHLASVVDDDDFKITHVIRAVEHLSNTPRQIFIAEGLGYTLPQYAHLPFIAEPGSQNKISKRKLDTYLKNPDFKRLFDHGVEIARRIGHSAAADTFNPVIVDFYAVTGWLPGAVLNYLALLGWSLDDKTEDFTVEELIKGFSLERVTKAPASFDPKKLWAFQDRHMTKLPIKQKVAKMVPFLQQAGLVATPPPCDTAPQLTRIVEAAGDRLKVAGDILAYADFFYVADDQLVYDAKDFEKRLKKEGVMELLRSFSAKLATVEPFTAPAIEAMMQTFLEEQNIKIGDIVHAVRVAVTGKGVGPGLYDCLELIGRESCRARIDRALEMMP
jgi:glutamyl-tRNA synthetase